MYSSFHLQAETHWASALSIFRSVLRWDSVCIQDSGSELASRYFCGEKFCSIKHRPPFNPASKVQNPRGNFQFSCNFEVRYVLREIFLEGRNNDLSLLFAEYGNFIFHRCGVWGRKIKWTAQGYKENFVSEPRSEGRNCWLPMLCKIPLSVKIGLWIILKANSNALWVSALQMLLVLLRRKGLLYECAAIIILNSYKHLFISKAFIIWIQQNTWCVNPAFPGLFLDLLLSFKNGIVIVFQNVVSKACKNDFVVMSASQKCLSFPSLGGNYKIL